jgi:hypothetical protein
MSLRCVLSKKGRAESFWHALFLLANVLVKVFILLEIL